MDWVRLYHEMPTDPKWRVIAKKSGQRIGDVIAVFVFVLTNASCNAVKRGETQGLNSEDIAAALNLEESDIASILGEMEGKVLKEGKLLGWEKRNPKREDSSYERVKKHRETHCNAVKRPDQTREEEDGKKLLTSFLSGRAGIGTGAPFTIQDPIERLARFQKTIADSLGPDGYRIVGEASDPKHPNFPKQLIICRSEAKKLGKGWPHQWPVK